MRYGKNMSARAGNTEVVTTKNIPVTTEDVVEVVIAVEFPLTTTKGTRLC